VVTLLMLKARFACNAVCEMRRLKQLLHEGEASRLYNSKSNHARLSPLRQRAPCIHTVNLTSSYSDLQLPVAQRRSLKSQETLAITQLEVIVACQSYHPIADDARMNSNYPCISKNSTLAYGWLCLQLDR
jgi:hypothetical protein